MPRPPKKVIPPRKTTPAAGGTLLAYWRIKRGMTQVDVARYAGIPIATYRRLERGKISNPRIGWLNNCGYVLFIDPTALLSDYEGWIPLPKGPKRPPPDPFTLHREGRFTNVPEPGSRRRKAT